MESEMKKRICCLVLLFFSLLSFNAFAAEETTIDIEKIVVTSSRSKEEIKNSTKGVTIIDEEDIQQSNAQTIPDLLRTEADVEIRDYNGTGKQVNVDMGGFGETGPTNMLVLIDGRRVNAVDLSNTDWSQISLSQVERIEIVRGANSVLYGDNASGGVVNIITKKGSGKPTLSLESKGGSYQTSSTSLESSGSDKKTSYRVSAEYFNTDGYRQNSQLFRKDFGLQLGHEFDPLLNTNLTFGYHEDEYGLPGALKESELASLGRRATTKPNDTANSQDYFANLEITNDFQDRGALTTAISGRVRSVDSDYISMSDVNDTQIVTLGLTPKYTLKSDLLNCANTLIIGGDFYHTKDGIMDNNLFAKDKIEISKDTLAFYVQDQFHPTERLTIKAGARREATGFVFNQLTEANLKQKSKTVDEAYEIGASYVYQEDSNVFANYSTSFRQPLVDEFFSTNSFAPFFPGGLNSSLSTQTGKNTEIGVRHSLTKKITGALSYFRHDISNEIFLNPETYANSNYDKTLHQGVEFRTDIATSDSLGFFTTYTLTQAEFGKGQFKGNQIPAVPMHKASAGIKITPNSRLRINVIANYVGSMYLVSDQANAFPKLNDYVTIDLNLRYSIQKDFELFINLNNILNEKYSEYGVMSSGFPPPKQRAFYPAPERNVLAGLRYKF